MRQDYTRGPSRFFIIHQALARFRGRGWFSAHQAARATFFGVGRVHLQRLKRVREMLQSMLKPASSNATTGSRRARCTDTVT